MSSPRVRRATSADVARAAGVSRTTVSYILNDTPHQKIPEETRRRVLDAAARLDYAPSVAARALRSGRSGVVLLLLPNWPIGPTVGHIVRQLTRVLADAGLALVTYTSVEDGAAHGPWAAVAPDAVLSLGDVDEEQAARMRAAGVAVTVGLAAAYRGNGCEADSPEGQVGRRQAAHLADTGRTELGYAWPDDERLRSFAQARLAGVRAVCAERGLAPPVVRTVPLEPEAASAAVLAWAGERVTGVCAYNDDVAMAVLAGGRRAALQVPADLAVVGVDDVPAAALTDPPLTTVVHDHDVLVRHLAATVLDGLAGRPVPSQPRGELVRLVVRASA